MGPLVPEQAPERVRLPLLMSKDVAVCSSRSCCSTRRAFAKVATPPPPHSSLRQPQTTNLIWLPPPFQLSLLRYTNGTRSQSLHKACLAALLKLVAHLTSSPNKSETLSDNDETVRVSFA